MTPEEQQEADRLLETLNHRVSDQSPFQRYFRNSHSGGDLDMLRCLEKLFTTITNDEFIAITLSQSNIVKYSDCNAADVLTKEMIPYYNRVIRACNEHDVYFQDEIGACCAYLFTHFDRADEIMFLLEERGITDGKKIAAALASMDTASLTKPLWGGAL